MTNTIPTISILDPEDSLLPMVVALADRNSKYLGHFPASCFTREATCQRILIATDEKQDLMGYLLYRVARNRAVIQHLCVDSRYRRAGVARGLVDKLVRLTSHLDGIALHCARAFEDAHAAWKRLGFVAIDEKPGRGRDARTLTRFWLDHRQPDLWTHQREQAASDTLVAVLDANVAFDLQDPSRDTASRSLPLTDDWLQELVSLWVADELFNEVDRHPDADVRRSRKHFLRGLQKLDADPVERQKVLDHLRTFVNHGASTSAQSDLIQIATAICGGADVFVTHDAGVLSHAQAIEEHYELRLVQPAELIANLDELTRTHDFAPAHLAGTPVTARLVNAASLKMVASCFVNHSAGEKRHQFTKCLHDLVAAATGAEVTFFSHPQHETAALLGVDKSMPCSFDVKLLRVRDRRFRATLVRLLIGRTIQRALEEGVPHVVISDVSEGDALESACCEMGFVPHRRGYSKLCLRGVLECNEVTARVGELASSLAKVEREAMRKLASTLGKCTENPAAASRTEQLLWPAVLTPSRLRSFVVPVQPQYATALFDKGLASQQLLGVDPELMFKCEHVYYKSCHAPVVIAPGRVLWYVSSRGSDRVRRIRGYSQVLETTIGDAKSLYRQFRRLGVYQWQDVASIANRHPSGRVMAIRFGPTEVFEPGVTRAQLAEILSQEGEKLPPLSTAVEVSARVFDRVFHMGVSGGESD